MRSERHHLFTGTDRPLGLVQVREVMMKCFKQARVLSIEQPIALGSFELLTV
jgi:hypothetical protein